MKKFYILFLALPAVYFTLMYFPIWWSVGIISVIMIFIAYRIYAVRAEALHKRTDVLEKEVEELHIRLERSVLKEQKTNKEAGQVKQLKQQLLSIISHEIRTPMNGIMGTALLLSDTPLTKEQQDYIATIRGCGESLLTTINNILVNDLLDFSKLQQEGNQLEYKDFDLRDCVEEVLDMFSGKTGKSRIDLVYELGPSVPEQIIGDSKRLRQVLINLIENAVKFTNKGEVYVGVQYTAHSQGLPPELNFEVRDTGVGIQKEQVKQLFKGLPGKEFQKGADTPSVGLGLVICKKLVELMGGQIEVQSEQHKGSKFTFNIPFTPSLKATRDHARQNDMGKMEGKHILIVDDNATSRTALVNQMKPWKITAVPACSGIEALEILAANKFDLVIADIDMAGMDGIELAKSIRNLYPALHIIGLNIAGDERHNEQRELFANVVSKPTRTNILRDSILNIFTPSITGKQDSSDPLSGVFADQHPLRILIAEDNPINQKIATKILTKLGYEPALANHGREVMEMVGHDHYDIILMDVQMPEMDGLEASRMIRTCLEVQPVIIAVTANAMQGDRDICMQAGMDDYMSKPIDLKELLNQLEKWSIAIREKRKLSA
ncbi:MAG: response regulator [Chitinophagaceae bacterium]